MKDYTLDKKTEKKYSSSSIMIFKKKLNVLLYTINYIVLIRMTKRFDGEHDIFALVIMCEAEG